MRRTLLNIIVSTENMRHCAIPAALCGYMSTLNNAFYLRLVIILNALAAQLARVAGQPATPRVLVSADFIVYTLCAYDIQIY